MIHSSMLDLVGHTPMIRLNVLNHIDLYVKLEFLNPTGSVKDRAADHIIRKLFERKEIDPDTTLIESSSGNFGVALSAYCRKYNLKFICVIDPHISPTNEMLISSMGGILEKVTEPDENGGYLLTRIKRVQELQVKIPNSYWVNQYANPYNAEAYYQTLGREICECLNPIDYAFIGVSSCGTIAGVSRKIKEVYPQAKIIAVDIEGSVIFGGKPKKRYIPGIGSSKVPLILAQARIDEVVMVDEALTVAMCHELLNNHQIFVGGSSGSVMGAIKKYFSEEKNLEWIRSLKRKPVVVTLFPDRGERYVNTLYDKKWCEWFAGKDPFMTAALRTPKTTNPDDLDDFFEKKQASTWRAHIGEQEG
ncbi:MAG: 2,3-diaminopropionate biosynthesis protein SbnA [Desulfobacteraceae bacterium]|nr:MAG: 2,3-diaminopropionate biosynthesis protein SbnA [Desulfobacteraceae bacterium]